MQIEGFDHPGDCTINQIHEQIRPNKEIKDRQNPH